MSNTGVVFEDRTFNGVHERRSGKISAGLEFRRCYFQGCDFSAVSHPRERTVVRNVRLIDCEERGCSINAAILENVTVDGLKTQGRLQTFGTVFKHVTLKGKIGTLMITPFVDLLGEAPEVQRAFDKANANYYKNVDWALDISEAQFLDCVFRTVPAGLIRRDPQTQVVVKRKKALGGIWRELKYVKNTRWEADLHFFLEEGQADIVLVAPKRDRRFLQLLDGLKALRNAGVAEAD